MLKIKCSAAIVGIGSVSNIGVTQGGKSNLELTALEGEEVVLSPVPFSLDTFVPKKKDQRSMSHSQAMAVYAAGLAIESAGILDDAQARHELRLLLSCSIGERDERVDTNILANQNEPDFSLHAELSKMRPTTILQRLPSLFLASVSMTYETFGETVSYVGETAAANASLKYGISCAEQGAGERVLVGGVFNGQQPIYHEMVEHNKQFSCYKELVLGSAAGFTVLQSDKQARADGQHIASINYWGEHEAIELELALSERSQYIAIMHELDSSSSLEQELLNQELQVLNVNQYIGNAFEGSTHTQINIALGYFSNELEQGAEVFLLSQNMSGFFDVFSLKR